MTAEAASLTYRRNCRIEMAKWASASIGRYPRLQLVHTSRAVARRRNLRDLIEHEEMIERLAIKLGRDEEAWSIARDLLDDPRPGEHSSDFMLRAQGAAIARARREGATEAEIQAALRHSTRA